MKPHAFFTEQITFKTFGEDVSNVRKSDLWKSRPVELSVDLEYSAPVLSILQSHKPIE